MFAGLLLVLAEVAVVAFAVPAPVLEVRQSVSTLSATQVASYKPYTYYAAAAGCPPDRTLAWNCGVKCEGNPGFLPIASGGDGAVTQYWYVGYDPLLETIIVSYQGTDPAKILPIVTDVSFIPVPLRPWLFPGVSIDLLVHSGFGNAHAISALDVLAAVQTGITSYGVTHVTIVGHSLGGAIAVIETAHLAVNLPSTITLRTITYGSPRVGNQAFADFVNSKSEMNRINNKKDPVPILPRRYMGFVHTEGEHHIVDSGAWVNCPGQDNTDEQCTIGYVPTVLVGDPGDHSGPYDGVMTGC